jgi:hypothetical protein
MKKSYPESRIIHWLSYRQPSPRKVFERVPKLLLEFEASLICPKLVCKEAQIICLKFQIIDLQILSYRL